MNFVHSATLRLGFLLAFVWGATAADPGAATGGTNSTDNVILTAEGAVEAMRAGAPDWTPARVEQVLKVRDQLRTRAKSRATLRLSNLSVLRVNELTTLEIQPPPETGQKSVLDLKSGAAYFFNREAPVETQFRTPTASGAIRGTEFNLAVDEDGKTVLTLLDGSVNLSNDQGSIALASGEQGIVEKGKAPRKTAVIDAVNIIQWALYYPAVLDPAEAGLSAAEEQALTASLTAYRSGDLLRAAADYPADRTGVSAAEQVYAAALLLAVGQVEEAEARLKALPSGDQGGRTAQLAQALRQLIAAVKHQSWPQPGSLSLATEWMAESYYQQSQAKPGSLELALKAAREAATRAPTFGYAWARVAELEFSFGRTGEALKALDKAKQHSPRNAEALSLNGFLLAARNQIRPALALFDQAIEIDGALGNAWLGRGLCRIHQGDAKAGRADLQTAATLEPNRAILRGYLGKALSNEGDLRRANQELDLAKKLDPNDPTSWLYAALLDQQQNRINEAISDLQKSQELNDNRRLFRSRMLLDQDRAVRGANLAAIYRDAGMTDLSVREASRAVNSDYANYSAHLFLANSYDALRDPRSLNLRYETPWLSELLVANLLAPVGAGTLSQNVSQQEYSKLLESDHLGALSYTEYQSRGDWLERGSQYGTYRDFSYSMDVNYRTQDGYRPNNDVYALDWWTKAKFAVTPQDTLFVQTLYSQYEAGDVSQYYDPAFANLGQRVKETQEPIVFLGLHHEWAPGSHTLILAGRLDDTSNLTVPGARGFFLRVQPRPGGGGFVTNTVQNQYNLAWQNQLEGYTAEAMHIWEKNGHTVVGGVRFQTAASSTAQTMDDTYAVTPLIGVRAKTVATDLQRFNVYAYDQWQVFNPLRLTFGLSYDRLHYPVNTTIAPITSAETSSYRLSPKAGFIFDLTKETHLRGAYTRSLGGVFFDQSVRLEPTQVAGFNQAFRSLIPESIVGLVPGSKFETWSLALDHHFKTDTYIGFEGDLLRSKANRTWGVLDRTHGLTILDATTPEDLGFQERTLAATVDQAIGKQFVVGARHQVSYALYDDLFPKLPGGAFNDHPDALLHQLDLHAIFDHRCGFFSQVNAQWYYQRWTSPLQGANNIGDDFWQFNAFIGYRFLQRRAEVRVGVLNLGNRDYNLYPLNLYMELPRQRTFIASLALTY